MYISRNANFFVIVSASNSSLTVTFIGEENAIIINNGMFENFMENFNPAGKMNGMMEENRQKIFRRLLYEWEMIRI